MVQPPTLWSDSDRDFFVCKIRAPRLLVTVRVFCLFHTVSKCTKTSQIHVQTYHFGTQIHYNNWKSCSTQQGRPLLPIYIKSVQSFSKYRLDKFGDRRMDGQTIKQVKNTLPLSASLAWWSHYES